MHARPGNFREELLDKFQTRAPHFKVGDMVTWTCSARRDRHDVPKGAIGIVLPKDDDDSDDDDPADSCYVKFPRGTWMFKAIELRKAVRNVITNCEM